MNNNNAMGNNNIMGNSNIIGSNNAMGMGRGNIMTMGSPWRDDIDVGYSHRTGLGVGLGGVGLGGAGGGLGVAKGPPPMINHNNTSLRPFSSGGFLFDPSEDISINLSHHRYHDWILSCPYPI